MCPFTTGMETPRSRYGCCTPIEPSYSSPTISDCTCTAELALPVPINVTVPSSEPCTSSLPCRLQSCTFCDESIYSPAPSFRLYTNVAGITPGPQRCLHPNLPPGIRPQQPNEEPSQIIPTPNQPPPVPSSSNQTQRTRPRSPSVAPSSTYKIEVDLARALSAQKIRRAELHVAQLKYQRSTADVALCRKHLRDEMQKEWDNSPDVVDETDMKEADDTPSPRPHKRVKLEDENGNEVMDGDDDSDSMSSPEI
ncbi:hypothetical protein SERLA73DRAFT_176104 [Serpula lacrymans var. lacrymans S7.3]|uniref:Uncharacterized protein n=1 Tax=Serpula lacrymans var. lacrymans (strain S7.3) TaxID=936435 RepID=F8PMB7_SERL3|nr:hypothetical protein SERLA73DRAFT_176104 [Serpula lacrymans var. lacrymans S7.3]